LLNGELIEEVKLLIGLLELTPAYPPPVIDETVFEIGDVIDESVFEIGDVIVLRALDKKSIIYNYIYNYIYMPTREEKKRATQAAKLNKKRQKVKEQMRKVEKLLNETLKIKDDIKKEIDKIKPGVIKMHGIILGYPETKRMYKLNDKKLSKLDKKYDKYHTKASKLSQKYDNLNYKLGQI